MREFDYVPEESPAHPRMTEEELATLRGMYLEPGGSKNAIVEKLIREIDATRADLAELVAVSPKRANSPAVDEEPRLCPFCGAEAVPERGWPECYYFSLSCNACGLSVRTDDRPNAEEMTVEKWNRLKAPVKQPYAYDLTMLPAVFRELDELRAFVVQVHREVSRGDGCGMTLSCAIDGVLSYKEAVAECKESNAALRAVLEELLKLDKERPVDTTWWRRHWDAALAKARQALMIGEDSSL